MDTPILFSKLQSFQYSLVRIYQINYFVAQCLTAVKRAHRKYFLNVFLVKCFVSLDCLPLFIRFDQLQGLFYEHYFFQRQIKIPLFMEFMVAKKEDSLNQNQIILELLLMLYLFVFWWKNLMTEILIYLSFKHLFALKNSF